MNPVAADWVPDGNGGAMWSGDPSEEPPEGADWEDSDFDGLPNWLEDYLGTDKFNPDSDYDGIYDGDEVSLATSCWEVDTDGDHLTDFEEYHQVFGAFNPTMLSTANDGVPDFRRADLTDTDGGGIPDRLELFWGLKPNDARDEAGDIDADGISNLHAYLAGHDIWHNVRSTYDTDGDGMTIVYEMAFGLNPNDNLDGADDPDGDYLTNLEESQAYTNPLNLLTLGYENVIIQDAYPNGELKFTTDGQGNPTPLMRAAQTDYEAVYEKVLVSEPSGSPVLVRGNGTVNDREYDEVGRLAKIAHIDPSGKVLESEASTYDQRDRRLTRTRAAGSTDLFRYDPAGQVTAAAYAQASEPQNQNPVNPPENPVNPVEKTDAAEEKSFTPNQTFVYDEAGNRLEVTDNGMTTQYQPNAANQYAKIAHGTEVVEPEYDPQGNLLHDATRKYNWDADIHLTAVSTDLADNQTTTTRFLYDPLHRRVARLKQGGEVTVYSYDGWNVVQEQTGHLAAAADPEPGDNQPETAPQSSKTSAVSSSKPKPRL